VLEEIFDKGGIACRCGIDEGSPSSRGGDIHICASLQGHSDQVCIVVVDTSENTGLCDLKSHLYLLIYGLKVLLMMVICNDIVIVEHDRRGTTGAS